MTDSPVFRDDLYRGTASFYDRYRLPYPAELIDDLCLRASVTGTGRLLDIACGPGTVTFELSDRFADVHAVDLEPEAIDFAKHRSTELDVTNVQWTAGRAEDVDPTEIFDLVTIGTAFHRLDRPRVADLAMRWLRSGGHLALLWADTPIQGSAPWQQELAAIVVDWMPRVGGARLPPSLGEHIAELPHVTVLEDAGFVAAERNEFSGVHDWTVEALLGSLYSTSILSLAALGDQRDAFEVEVCARLTAIEPSGIFREATSFAYDLAYRPPENVSA